MGPIGKALKIRKDFLLDANKNFWLIFHLLRHKPTTYVFRMCMLCVIASVESLRVENVTASTCLSSRRYLHESKKRKRKRFNSIDTQSLIPFTIIFTFWAPTRFFLLLFYLFATKFSFANMCVLLATNENEHSIQHSSDSTDALPHEECWLLIFVYYIYLFSIIPHSAYTFDRFSVCTNFRSAKSCWKKVVKWNQRENVTDWGITNENELGMSSYVHF